MHLRLYKTVQTGGIAVGSGNKTVAFAANQRVGKRTQIAVVVFYSYSDVTQFFGGLFLVSPYCRYLCGLSGSANLLRSRFSALWKVSETEQFLHLSSKPQELQRKK